MIFDKTSRFGFVNHVMATNNWAMSLDSNHMNVINNPQKQLQFVDEILD